MRTILLKLVVVAAGVGVVSCVPKSSDKNSGGGASGLASVTINQPKLKESMKASMADTDKTKLYDSLVYQITIAPIKSSGKDDCDANITPTQFDSGILELSKAASDTVKVKTGCNYLVSMKYGVKSDDGKAMKSILLQSWDSQDPSKLTKEELVKAAPQVAVKLYVTTEGQSFWDIAVIETPVDSDVSVNPSLASKVMSFALNALNLKVNDRASGTIEGSLELTPAAARAKETVCAVMVRGEFVQGTSVNVAGDVEELFSGGSIDKSIIKIPANSVAKVTVNVTGNLTLPNSFDTVKAKKAFAYCADDEATAIAALKSCIPAVPVDGVIDLSPSCMALNSVKN